MIHNNSAESNRQVPHGQREALVLAVLTRAGRAMTDREICTTLGAADMNYARPAITNLKQRGVLVEVGDMECPVTGRTVRLVYFPEEAVTLWTIRPHPEGGR